MADARPDRGLSRAHRLGLQPRQHGVLAGYGVTAQHVPVGYVPALSRISPSPAPDIDVLFIGSLAERRLGILRALSVRGRAWSRSTAATVPARQRHRARQDRAQHPLPPGQGLRDRARLVPAGQPLLRGLGEAAPTPGSRTRSRAASRSPTTIGWSTPASPTCAIRSAAARSPRAASRSCRRSARPTSCARWSATRVVLPACARGAASAASPAGTLPLARPALTPAPNESPRIFEKLRSLGQRWTWTWTWT